MASAGIDISITGNASAFLASLRAAEAATRQVSDAASAVAAREEAAYRRASAEAAGRARAQVTAAGAVRRAETEAAQAAQRAAQLGTEAARAEARAKIQALAAARAAHAAAVQQAAAALAAAQAQQRAMQAAARAALEAADAYRRAAEAAARAAAGANNNPPPDGGNPPPGGGGGGGGGGNGGGGRRGRGGRGGGGGGPGGGGGGGGGRRGGGGLNGNTSGAMDLNMTYQVLQDLIQGGPGAIANQVPIIMGLLGKYGKILGGIGGILTVGVGLGRAIVDPGGFLESMKGFTDKIDALKGAVLRPEKARAAMEEWLAGFSEMAKTAEAMDDRLKAFNIARDLKQAELRGAATGSNAEGLANAARAGAEGRANTLDRNLTAREQAAELERVRIEGILNEETRRKALADFEAKAAMEQALIRKRAAEEEFAIRERENKAAQKALDELNARAKKEKLPDGVTGTTKALTEINAARPGVESRANAAKAALTEAGKAVTEAAAGEQAAAFAAEVEKRRIANEEAARAADQAREESTRRMRRFWDDLAESVRTGIENAKRAAAQAASKKEADEDLEVLQLRARGRNRAADKLQKERDIQKSAKDYQDSTGATPEQARAYAEQKYDATHSNGRIRGAGRRSGTEPAPAFGLDNPGFTPGRLGVRPSEPGAFTGLDALNEMQKKNRRIRGAGNKERDQAAADAAGAAAGAAGNAVGGGVGGVVQALMGRLASMDRKLDYLSPAKQIRKN